jgi:two-component sensor histidine kinase
MINQIQPASVIQLDKYLEKVKYDLAKKLSFLFTFVFALLSVAHLEEEIGNLISMVCGFIICLGCFLYNYKTKNYKLVYYVISIAGVSVTGLTLNLLPTATHFGDFIWMFCAIALAFFGLSSRIGVTLLIISTISIICFVLFHVNENITLQQPRTNFQKFALIAELVAGFYAGIYMIYLIVKFHNFSEKTLKTTNKELQLQYDKIKLQDEEKTILVKEIHHRVKNNLQIISSLLRMQSHELKNEESKHHFQEAIDRILAMSMIHQKLYQGESLAKVNLKEYFEDLIVELIRLYDNKIKVSQTIKLEVDKIGLKSIVPLGLLVNELVSNSLKHAFRNRDYGEIKLTLTKNKNGIELQYSDNGIWSGEVKTSGFGLELIEILIEQLEGESNITKSAEGTAYCSTCPELAE